MSRPRLLDLFCGAGGAAMGYHRAGFDVVGVDIKPQPHYPFVFMKADALEVVQNLGWFFPWAKFAAIHASPPCQGYANVTLWRGKQGSHARLIEPVRSFLESSGLPWVIENVRTPALRHPIRLCGSQFDLAVQRHRYFEASFALPVLTTPCQHRDSDLPFEHKQEHAFALAMGIDWMTNREGRQAIPPAYTEWIGKQLLAALEVAA
jgi:hypothetical protein